MKTCLLLSILFIGGTALAAGKPATPVSPEAQATYKDIEATFGSVPTFLKQFPQNAIAGAWAEMKNLQANPNTAIPPKYKELLGLGVAAQVPCGYCVYFHTEMAKLDGATEDEVKEAVAEASVTRYWSTIMNGSRQDEPAFKAELGRAVEKLKKAPPAPPTAGEVQPIMTAQAAWSDIEKTFGLVPTFMRGVSDEAIAGAWTEYKTVELMPGAMPVKYKLLESLGISSQIPCANCTMADAEFATKLEGATEREVHEAVTMAAVVRHWSTYLNGIQTDESKFRKEVDQVVAHLKKKGAGKSASK